MSDIGKNFLKLMVALLKHHAKKIFGEEALGVAAETIVELSGEKTQASLESVLGTKAGSAKLLEVAEKADDCFRKKCKDRDLYEALTMPMGDLPSVQKALSELPENIDEEELLETLRDNLKRDFPNLSTEQVESGVNLYADCLHHALLPLEKFTLQIIGQAVFRNEWKLNELGVNVQTIKAILEDWKAPASPYTPQWLRPSAPRPRNPVMIGRQTEFDAVKAMLKPGAKTTITASVQGLPGVGKTVLAEHLAMQLDKEFPGGVLLYELGSKFRDPVLANPILNEWGMFAFGGGHPEHGIQFAPDQVRALLSGHGSMLFVLDDIWDVQAIQPLLNALPNEASLLTTTRSQRIARELHGFIYPLEILSPEDAMALLRTRLRQFRETDGDLLSDLADGLGCHAMALDIASGSLDRLPRSEWESSVKEMIRQVREGSGFGEITLPGDEKTEGRVEAALAFSYFELSEEAQMLFRFLGAFAPDGDYTVEAAAEIWKCSTEVAKGQLAVFVERGLLTHREATNSDDRWQQHSLLRAYALALLIRADEEQLGRSLQARIYDKMMEETDKQQVYYRMLPDYSQLRHAFEWAIEHNLELAQSLINHTESMQVAFYLAKENYEWTRRLVQRAKKSDDRTKASAIATMGAAVARLANLPSENRRARLIEALATYDEAQKFYHPDAFPSAYATNQNNRGNVLRGLAACPDEDGNSRLLEALAAYDEALKFCRRETSPRAYILIQNNRGNVLRNLAASPENRRVHLLEILAALDEVLQHSNSDAEPLDFALTQNNRGNVLSDLSSSPEEDSYIRLIQALAAYDEALKFRRPDRSPRGFALTQNNRGNVLHQLAVYSENHHARLLEALTAYNEALKFRRPDTSPLEYALTQSNRGRVLSDLALFSNEDRHALLLEALAAYDESLKHYQSDSPREYAAIQNSRSNVLLSLAASTDEDHRAQLLEAQIAFKSVERMNAKATHSDLSIMVGKKTPFIVAFSSGKGGVAKTTSTLSLGAALAELNYHILLIDLDAQANLSLALGFEEGETSITSANVLIENIPLDTAIIRSDVLDLDLIPSNSRIANAEQFLPMRQNFMTVLRNALKTQLLNYDFILLDCPPGRGVSTLNALSAADLLIIPTQPEYFSAYSLKNMMDSIGQVRRENNPKLAYRILVTLLNYANQAHQNVFEQLQATFGQGVFTTVIEIDTKLGESHIIGMPITQYRPNSRASQQYRVLAQELIEYIKKEEDNRNIT